MRRFLPWRVLTWRVLTWRRLLVLGVLIAAAVGWWAWGPDLSIDWFRTHESSLRAEIAAHPIRSLLVSLLLFVAVSLVPGTRGKAVVVGWLLGLWRGLLVVNFGLTAAAIVAFLMSRRLLRDALYARYGYYLDRINRLLEQHGPQYVFVLRLLGIAPYSLTNYACGATKMPLRTYWWTTQCGLLPGNLLFVYAGASLPTLDVFIEQGIWAFATPHLIALAGGLLAVSLLGAWLVKHLDERRKRNSPPRE